MSQSARTVWIEIVMRERCRYGEWSQSARTVWIEIDKMIISSIYLIVTVCEDCVD